MKTLREMYRQFPTTCKVLAVLVGWDIYWLILLFRKLFTST